MPSKFVNQLLSEINKFRADPSEITKSCELVKKGMSRINGKDPFLKEIDKFISEIQDLPEMNQLTLNPTLTKIAEEQVKEFKKIKAPIFTVLGNHDGWYDKDGVREVLQNNGITVLENSNVKFEGLSIAGVEEYP